MVRGRVVHPTEPLWSADDLDAALAFERWLIADRASRCHRCGTRRDDWRDDNDRPLRQPAWATKLVECDGCQVLHENRLGSNDERRHWASVDLVPFDPDGGASEEPPGV